MPASETKGTTRQQRRGRERRKIILDSFKELLIEKGLEEISLSDLATRCEIPPGSLYHFYPSLPKLFGALAAEFYSELRDYFRQSYRSIRADTWQGYLDNLIQTSCDFYRANPAYQELILSGKASDDVKRKARLDDFFLLIFRRDLIQRLGLPAIANDREIFNNTLQIVELMLSLTVIREGELSERGVVEAKRAGRAYLGLYFPAVVNSPDNSVNHIATNESDREQSDTDS
ncbi:MAG: TetR/AcrR family transcriptional regulator [bacterium]|nr:TetR/AcrR family transcriptional regulator [bacterium]